MGELFLGDHPLGTTPGVITPVHISLTSLATLHQDGCVCRDVMVAVALLANVSQRRRPGAILLPPLVIPPGELSLEQLAEHAKGQGRGCSDRLPLMPAEGLQFDTVRREGCSRVHTGKPLGDCCAHHSPWNACRW